MREQPSKQDKFYDTLSWYFGERHNLKGAVLIVSEKVQELNGVIRELNTNLVKADESSSRLTRALNRITVAGVIIAFLTLVLGLVSFAFEVHKFNHQVSLEIVNQDTTNLQYN